MKRRSLAILLAGAVALCSPISAAAGSDVDIIIEEESDDSGSVIMEEKTDDTGIVIVEEEFDDLDSVSMEDDAGEVTEEESSFDLSDLEKDIKLNYRHFEGEDDFESVTQGAEDNRYNVISDKAFPSKYITSNLPALRDQNPYGSCWAHAAIALAEISLSQKGLIAKPDLSELHMAYFSYNSEVDPLGGTKGDHNGIASGCDYSFLDMGGNVDLAFHTLMTWQGAADETTAPYKNAEDAINKGLSGDIAYKDVAHLENYYMEHYTVNNELNLNSIKELITRHGAVAISYDHSFEYPVFNEKNNCYYNDGDYMGGGHAVTVVGWDDDFSRDNFTIKPEGNGAWLVRNSWYDSRYPGWGIDEYSQYGYFWMSYYEATMSDEVYAADFAPDSNYAYNYQYDGCSTGFGCTGNKFANVFTASGESSAEAIMAVSFATESSNVHYKVRIYTNVLKENNPESGKLAATVSGVTDYAGYYTVKLPEPVSVSKGSRFSIIIEGIDSSREFDLEFENTWRTEDWFDCISSAEKGQSFVYYGYGWRDMVEYGGNARIRAFTDDSSYVAPSTIKFDKNNYDIIVGQDYKPAVTIGPENATNKGYILESSNTKVVQVFDGVKLLGVSPGTATITAVSNKGNLRAKAKVTVLADKKSFTYNIKFNGNKSTSGSMKALKKCEFDVSYVLPANKFKRKGYDFVGWNTQKDGTGKTFADGESVKQLVSKKGENVTLYAQWKLNTYSITYVLNGGKNDSENPSSYNVITKTIKLQKPVREGYTFGGWFKQYKDDKFKSKASQISKGSAGDVTLYAKWTMNKYNISFNGNKSTRGKMAKLKKCEYFTTYTLPENQFVKKGYVFTGWNTKKDGTGISIGNKADLYKPSFVTKNGQNITLYAQWKIEE